MRSLYLTEGYLDMAMELARPRTGSTVPQEERVHRRGVGRVGGPEPGAGTQHNVCQLREAELQGLVVLEQDQAMAGLAVLEQVASGDCVLPLDPTSGTCKLGVRAMTSGDAFALSATQLTGAAQTGITW